MGGSEVNKLEQVSSDSHKMSPTGGPMSDVRVWVWVSKV